ncbi:MAG: hypothetical protein V1696_01460 [Candidatus Jorgensenbacteria bacterium]
MNQKGSAAIVVPLIILGILMVAVWGLLTSGLVVFAQEPIPSDNLRVNDPSYPRPIQSAGSPWLCVNLNFNGDEYCLRTQKDRVESDQGAVLGILDLVKSKLLETISENYFSKHFDLKQVLIGEQDTAIDFSYNIGEYSIDYRVFVRAEGVNKNVIPPRAAPREIAGVVNKDAVFSEARKCIGTENVIYGINPAPGSMFELLAIGDEPNPGNHNHFEMDLETSKVSCSLVTESILEWSAVSPKEPRQNVPCYDCWKSYIPYVAGVGAIILVVSGTILYREKRGGVKNKDGERTK